MALLADQGDARFLLTYRSARIATKVLFAFSLGRVTGEVNATRITGQFDDLEVAAVVGAVFI